jgi:hypothetical protein
VSADEIRRELAAARADARRLAAEQQAWRARVTELVERAHDAGLSLDEIVEELGLSGKWAEHLKAREVRRRRFEAGPGFFFGSV